jgi:hypothetical protein
MDFSRSEVSQKASNKIDQIVFQCGKRAKSNICSVGIEPTTLSASQVESVKDT